MKTAVQQVFSDLEELHPNLFNVYTTEGKEFINHFHKYLAIEKEQMKIYQIDKELFKKLPIEGVNCTSFNVNQHRYFATKYYIDNFKDNFKPETNETL